PVPIVVIETIRAAIVGNVEIHVAVRVVVSPRGALAISDVGGTGGCPDLGEGPIRVVPVEAVRAAPIDEVEVGIAVVVIVCPGHPSTSPGVVGTGCSPDVGERPIAVVPVEPVRAVVLGE